MSRLDEALRRTDRIIAPSNASAHQEAFVSAWPANDREPVHRDVAEFDARGASPVAMAEPRTRGRFSDRWRELLAMPEGSPVMVEQFRRLAATLHNAQAATGVRRLLVTSAAAADGKTLTAVNLALVLSHSYRRRVLLIDADLRRPSLGSLVDVSQSQGLSEGLKDESRKLTVIELTPTLTLLPAGQPDIDPIMGLSSPRMRSILEEGAKRFDWVIVDAPPVGPVADASLLAEHVEGILLVVRAGHTQHDAVQRAVDVLGRERILGVVLNGLDEMPEPYGYWYGEQDAGATLRSA